MVYTWPNITQYPAWRKAAYLFAGESLKHQIKNKGRELIRLWELFDDTVRYEEEPSGVHAGLVAIKTKRESEYRAYEACRRQIDGLIKGLLKVNRDKAIKTLQTLFLVHIAHTRQQGLTPEEIANEVLIERDTDAIADENIQHYETLAEALRKELRQIVLTYDDDQRSRYRFEPVYTGVDPRFEFQKARDEAEGNQLLQDNAWTHLLGLDEWPVRTRQITLDLSSGVKSIFRQVAPGEDRVPGLFGRSDYQTLEIFWQGRLIAGRVDMCNLSHLLTQHLQLPSIESDQTDLDFAVWIGTKAVSEEIITRLLSRISDSRVLFWTPAELTAEEHGRLLDMAAYRKLVDTWGGKEDQDSVAVINWVAQALQTDMAKIAKVVDGAYARGRMDALNNTRMLFHVAGELVSILEPIIDRLLTSVYESRVIKFEPPFQFRKEEVVKVINGIVKTGSIPRGAKPNQDISAVQNFGFGLQVIKRGADKELNTHENPFVQALWKFVDDKLGDDGQAMKIETLYKNFMGVGGPKDYGLSRRLVQLYLLCLVQQGKVRVSLGAKSGLAHTTLDYSNIAQVDFSAKVLDSMIEVAKLAKPEHWEALRPYAEKLLGEAILSTHDDALISEQRTKLRELFAREGEAVKRLRNKADSLFNLLQVDNPYAREVTQFGELYAIDLTTGNDIDLILFGLKEAFGYQAYDTSQAEQSEVDDLAVRLTNYRDLLRFIEYDSELRAAHAYCALILPDLPNLKGTREMQRQVAHKLNQIQPFIDSEVALKTELIGSNPPQAGEKGTIRVLLKIYSDEYLALHEQMINRIDQVRSSITVLTDGIDMRALEILEKIKALYPPVTPTLRTQWYALRQGLWICSNPSVNSVRDELERGPIHQCGLTFANHQELLHQANEAAVRAQTQLIDAITGKMSVLISPAIRKRLEQGRSEPLIAGMLKCTTVAELWDYLSQACLKDPKIVDIINKYLKRIVVKVVKISDFHPTITTVEQEQIAQIGQELSDFLEEQLKSSSPDEDTFPILQLE